MMTGFEKYTRKTRRALFLEEMEQVVPWRELCALVAPHYPKSFFFSSRRRHTRLQGDWSSDVCFPIFCAVALFGGATPFGALVPPAQAKQSSAQREFVLKQIRLPHHYYYREMYLPQVTSGPASVSWSPDGAEVVYAMQGSLW